ncbi:hypothetical protein D3C80_949780 [compost metagenome]
MNYTVIKDVLLAAVWMVFRIVPLWLFYHMVTHIREDKFLAGLFLTTIMFIVVYGFVLFVTNSWPALFWRYSSRLETRQVRHNDDDVHQVKLFGHWYFIHIDDGEAVLSFRTWFSPQRFYESYQFQHNFLKFINAHREDQTPNVKNNQTYVRGEVAKK